jgi:hypothetical protein
MTFLFSRCTPGPDGSLVIPAKHVERWRTIAETPWEKLWPAEQDTDRQQAKALEEEIDGNPRP